MNSFRLLRTKELSTRGYYSDLSADGMVTISHKRPKILISRSEENYHLLSALGTDADAKIASECSEIALTSLGCRNCRIIQGDISKKQNYLTFQLHIVRNWLKPQ